MRLTNEPDCLGSEAGLAGVSGSSGDVRDLEAAAGRGEPRAQLAPDVFVESVRRYLGAFIVKLGGVDVITFSGGIGENSPDVRSRVCARLGELGIELHAERNRAGRGEARISSDRAKVAVFVLPADEERVVARATAEVLRRSRQDR